MHRISKRVFDLVWVCVFYVEFFCLVLFSVDSYDRYEVCNFVLIGRNVIFQRLFNAGGSC